MIAFYSILFTMAIKQIYDLNNLKNVDKNLINFNVTFFSV